MANRLRNWIAGLVLVVWFGAMLLLAGCDTPPPPPKAQEPAGYRIIRPHGVEICRQEESGETVCVPE